MAIARRLEDIISVVFQREVTYTVADMRGKQFPLSTKMMNPTSMPDHYKDLAAELDQLPGRSRFQSFMKRLSGMVRWK